jgi:hypothetical protein
VERQRLEPELGGVRLRLVKEILKEAKKILDKKKNA